MVIFFFQNDFKKNNPEAMIHNIPCSTFEKLKAQTDVQAFCPLIGW